MDDLAQIRRVDSFSSLCGVSHGVLLADDTDGGVRLLYLLDRNLWYDWSLGLPGMCVDELMSIGTKALAHFGSLCCRCDSEYAFSWASWLHSVLERKAILSCPPRLPWPISEHVWSECKGENVME